MITGKSSGSGTYSYEEASAGPYSVITSHMPEETWTVRIVFKHHGETDIPILKCTTIQAQLLWVALSGMAEDLRWESEIGK